jgi:hypothetical protein
VRDGPAYYVSVKNIGLVTSDCVVLGFITSNHTDAPKRELFDFARLAQIAPGKAATALLTIPPHVASLIDRDGTERLLSGGYTVQIQSGDPSVVPLVGQLQLEGSPVTLFTMPNPSNA